MTKMTKVAQAKQIVESNPEASRSELVKMFMEQLGMSKAGATTYGYNLAKGAAKRVKKVVERAVKPNPKAIKSVKVPAPEATLVVPEVRTPEEYTKEEAAFDAIAAKLAAKRERDAARKREKRAAEKALRETLKACAA
jgi:hypothetical protein